MTAFRDRHRERLNANPNPQRRIAVQPKRLQACGTTLRFRISDGYRLPFSPMGLSLTKRDLEPYSGPIFFKQFQAIPVEGNGLASPGGFEPPLPP